MTTKRKAIANFPPSGKRTIEVIRNVNLNKQDYLVTLRTAIHRMNGYEAVWRETVHVHETFQGKTVWKGDVEVFELIQHRKAKRAYAWVLLDGQHDDKIRFVVVLDLPPVKDARTAVRASMIAGSKPPQS